jgi:hypothetical protein
MPRLGTFGEQSVQVSIKEAISLGTLCLVGLLALHLDTHPVVLATWVSLTVVAAVVLLSEKEGARLYVRRRPNRGGGF